MPRIKKAVVTDNAELQPSVPKKAEDSPNMPKEIHLDNKRTIIPNFDNEVPFKKKRNKSKQSKNTGNNSTESSIQEPIAKIRKLKFKEIHIKDTYWLENDIHQTIEDITEGKKSAKALILNQALKDYLKQNNIEIKPLRVKEKKN